MRTLLFRRVAESMALLPYCAAALFTHFLLEHSFCFRRYQYQRVFDTVRCASLAVEPSVMVASTPTGPGMPRLVVNTTSTPIAEISPSYQKAQSVLQELTATAETDYP